MVTALFPAVATLIALRPPALIVGLVIDTSYAAFTALAPAVILGFYWPRATTQGARWSISLGLTAALVIIGWWHNPFGLNVYNAFWTLVISTVVLVSVFPHHSSRTPGRAAVLWVISGEGGRQNALARTMHKFSAAATKSSSVLHRPCCLPRMERTS